MALERLLNDIRHCRICEGSLPLEPRPVLSAAETATLLIVGQAPGTRVHETGIPWNDPSGDRLRQWLELDKSVFYDTRRIAILSMGFCYPGKGKSGDLPPRPECAYHWREKLHRQLPNIRLTLLIGQYAQRYYLAERFTSLTETVRAWQAFQPDYIPLPHPSPRNNIWLRRNEWFAQELLPVLKKQVHQLIK
ncbi:MAG: uracil-DNA glycosylase family protein [Pseudomonadales bacterium]|jgi:uracil-DNA glycosylase